MMNKRTYFKVCPECGDNLDPGEICSTCKELEEQIKAIYPPCLRVLPLVRCNPKPQLFLAVREDSTECIRFLSGVSEGDMLVCFTPPDRYKLDGSLPEMDKLDDDIVRVHDYIVRPLLKSDGSIMAGYYKVSEATFLAMFSVKRKWGWGQKRMIKKWHIVLISVATVLLCIPLFVFAINVFAPPTEKVKASPLYMTVNESGRCVLHRCTKAPMYSSGVAYITTDCCKTKIQCSVLRVVIYNDKPLYLLKFVDICGE